ncbi:hypothetical protein AH03_9 [Erwinia phage AH03]|uniref:Uncharacterized protein n=1 Tax=Erwinia phage AH03 TaxID=2869568 RepID=A0AAE7X0D2_9CAUD|nr:hypothetical protein AH03_9 [Erwinia phage AH03]
MTKMSKGRKTQHVARGGPYDGRTLWLHTAGTLSFRVQSYDRRKGHYDQQGIWVFDE